MVHARKLGVQLSPDETNHLKREIARRVAHDGTSRWFTRSDFGRMVTQAHSKTAERETLVEYISKTDEKTAGQKLLLGLDFLGTSLFALIGTQVAGQAGMNVVGAVLVGCVASMGGGTLNNLMTGNTKGGTFWMRDSRFLLIGIWTSLLTFYLWPEYEEWQAQRDFKDLARAAGDETSTALTLFEFERALSAQPNLCLRIIKAVRPRLDQEACDAIDAAPALAPALVFEWLCAASEPSRGAEREARITPDQLRMVASSSTMDSPLIFGLETVALGAVAVIGAQAGITRGVGPLGSVATGVTICFGGVVRDVLCQRDIAIGAQSYALATCAGASVYVGLRQLVCRGLVQLPLIFRILAGAGTAVGQRIYVYVSDATDHLLEPMRVAKRQQQLSLKREPVNGSESLCEAAARNDVYELKILVHDMKVNPLSADYDRRTALHLAAAEGSMDAARFLVNEAGVHLSPRDRWGRTPLDEALLNSHHLLAAYLRTRYARKIVVCCRRRHTARIDMSRARRGAVTGAEEGLNEDLNRH